jgi:DnaD/phage-associated family protein
MNTAKFKGFPKPISNYSKLPHTFIEELHNFKKLSALKCVLYVLRHTWGYQEYGIPKIITKDEFMNGRKRKDGSRIDPGTGLSGQGVLDGLEWLVEQGYLLEFVNDKDKARIKKAYMLAMDLGVYDLDSKVYDLDGIEYEFRQRTEKDTNRKKLEETIEPPSLFSCWETILGLPMLPHYRDTILEWEERYSYEWIVKAMKEAADQNVRKPKYVQAILENWQAKGRIASKEDKPDITTKEAEAVEHIPLTDEDLEERQRQLKEARKRLAGDSNEQR